jgi:hypothetical protein
MIRLVIFLACLAPLLTMAQATSSSQAAPSATAKLTPQASQSVPLLESFLGRGWPGSKAETLSELALLPVIGTYGRALPSALEWKATSKNHIYQGFKASNGLEFHLGDFRVSQLIAITDQVHVKHLWLGVATRDPKAEAFFKETLSARFGQPKTVRNVRKGAFPKTVTTWVQQFEVPKRQVAYALEATYSEEAEYFAGGIPVSVSLHTYEVGDIVSLFFDPYLFAMDEAQLRERFTLLGLSFNSQSSTQISGFFGMSGELSCHLVSDRLQAMQIRFPSDAKPDTGARMISVGGRSFFMEAMKELISTRNRSFPTTSVNIRSTETPTVGLNSYPVGRQSSQSTSSRQTTTLPLGEQSFQNETKLVWSMRSWEGNYMLSGHRLTAYPPGVDVAKILDPAIGTLVGLSSVERLFEDIPYVFTALDFDRYRGNLRKHPEGGIYIEVPMIDQGASSFCYPASMARILNYYGRNVDMQSVANVAGSDATSGTDLPGVLSALSRAAARLEVYPLPPKGSGLAGFAMFVRDQIDKGQPVLWLCQVKGVGHARVINGYDALKQEVIFTDSYGAGFEANRMSLREAFATTDHYLSFVPKEIQKVVRAR